MKTLFALLLVLSLASCKKDKLGPCYDCHVYGQLNGVLHDRWEEYCGDALPQYYDSWGNPINTTCTKR